MTNELAVGYVSISAETRGMGRAIANELRGLGPMASKHGKAMGLELQKGLRAAKPVDLADLQQAFTDAEKQREAAVRRTTENIEGYRRKEEIAQAKVTEAEKKYAANSSQVLTAKDRLRTASQKLELAEARAAVEVERADRNYESAKDALDEYAKSQEGFAGKAKNAFGKIKGLFSATASDGAKGGAETGRRFSKGLEREMDSGSKRGGSIFMGNLKAIFASKAIMGVVSTVKGAITSAFGGGWDRLMNIEAAEAKFDALGMNAGAAMDRVSAAVDGTRFAISDAADMASVLGAAGISENGKEMERWLKITGDSAQFMNREFSDMQNSIQKVAQEGRVTGETFQELPIATAALAEHLGKSQEEVRKLASQGKISSEDFLAAMEAKIGGMASGAGGTLSSMISNVKTAASATMANLMGGVVDGLGPVMEKVLEWMKGVRDAAKPIGKRLGEIFGQITDKLSTLSEPLQALGGELKGAFDVLVSGDFSGGIFGLDANHPAVGVLSTLRDTVLYLKDELVALVTGPGIGKFFDGMKSALGGVINAILPIVDAILPKFREGVEKIKPAFSRLMEGISPFIAAIGRLIDFLKPVLIPVFQFLADVVISAVKGAIDGVALTLRGLVDVIDGVIGFVKNVFAGEWGAAWESIKQLFWGVIQTIGGAIWTWMNVTVGGAIRGGMAKALGFFKGGWGTIKNLFTATLNWLKGLLSGAWNAIRSNTGAVWNGIKSTISTAWSGIKSTVLNVANAIKGGLSGIWSGIKSTASSLWNGIKSTITGAVNRLKSGVETAFRTMKNNVSNIWNGVKAAVKSPIKFVVETVINKGLIGSFNSLISKIGLENLSIAPVALPQGFATGGWTGPGSKYKPAGIVHADEHVWTKEEMRKFPGGHKAMERMREAVRKGDYSYQLGGYASGGRVRAPFAGGSWNGGRYRSGKYHGGIDYPRAIGTSVGAPEAGTVIKTARLTTSYGIHAVIRGAWDHILAHLSRLYVAQGQRVSQGQTIGAVGSTGNSTGPHLHWEVRPRGGRYGSAVNPLSVASGAMAAPSGPVAESPVDKLKGMLKGVASKAFSLATAAKDYVSEFLKDPLGHITKAFSKAISPSGGAGIIGRIVDAIPLKVADALKTYMKGLVGFAGGTVSAPRGPAWVGERGPELVYFRGGERVLTHHESLRATQPSPTLVRVELVDERMRGLIRAEVRRMQREGLVYA